MTSEAPQRDLLSLALSGEDSRDVLARAHTSLIENPEDPLALAAQAVALQQTSGNASEIMESFLKAANAALEDHVIFGQVARAAHSLKLTDPLLEKVLARVNQPGSDGRDWWMLGRFQFFLDRNAAAVKSLKQATSLLEPSSLLWFDLARAAVDAAESRVALDALDRLAQIEPDSESTPIVVTVKIAALVLGNQPQAALNLWRTAPLPLPNAEAQRRGLELAEALIADTPPNVESALEVLTRIEPVLTQPEQRWPALRIRASALIIAGKYDDALKTLEGADAQSIGEEGWIGSLFWQAVALERSGQADAALARTENGLTLAREEHASIFHLIRARVFNSRRDYSQAIENLDLVKMEFLPETLQPEAELHRAIALAGLKQHEAALAQLEKARGTKGNPSMLGAILFWQGLVLQLMSRFQDAVNAYEEASKERSAPELPIVIGEAQSLHGLGRTDDAIQVLDRAMPENPDATTAVELSTNKAGLLTSLKKFDAAIAVLDSVLSRKDLPRGQFGNLHLLRAIYAQAAGSDHVAAALDSATVAMDNLPADGSMLGDRIRALAVRTWALHEKGDAAGALASLEEARENSPALSENLDFLSEHWGLLIELGRNQEGLQLIENIISGSLPIARHPAVLMYRAESLRRMGDLQGYFAAMEQVNEVPPEYQNDRNAWFALGLAETVPRAWSQAQTAMENIQRLDRQFFESPQVRVIRSLILVGLRELEPALSLLKDIDSLPVAAPWKMLGALSQAQALSELGNFNEAIRALDRVIAFSGSSTDTEPALAALMVFQKANCLIRLDRADEALAVIETARTLPKSTTMGPFVALVQAMTRAGVLYRLKRNDEALESINDAIQIESGSTAGLPGALIDRGRLRWIKGVILMDLNREEEALQAFEQAETAGLKGNEAAVWQGYALLALEDPDRALRAFEAALANAVSHSETAQQFEALVGKGRALQASHIYESALGVYRQALRTDSISAESDPHYWRRIGEASYALERYTPALAAFRRGWKIQKNVQLALGISAVLIRQKRFGEARDFLETEVQPADAKEVRLVFNKGLALWSLGKKDQAKRLIQNAADAGVIEAADFVNALKPKSDGTNGWWDTWFGDQVSRRKRIVGACLFIMVLSALTVPGIAYFQKSLDWKIAVIPAVAGLVLLLVPSIKGLSLGTEGVKVEIEPTLKGVEGAPTPDILPLGAGVYIFAASLQAFGGQSKVPQPELRINLPKSDFLLPS